VVSTAAGVYLEHASFWTDRLRTVAGLRVDRQDNRVDASLAANGGREADAIVSPRLAVAYAATPTLEAFASAGRGFHSNDARGTTTRIDPRSGEPVVPVRPLVPTVGSELGLRWIPSPAFAASLAAWQLRIGSELVFVGDAGTTEPSRESRRQGIEVSARWLPAPWLALDADLSGSRARFVDDDPAGPFVPGSVARVAAFAVTVQQAGRWSGGLRLRHVGPRPLIEDGSVRSQPFTLADLRVGWRLADGVDLLLDVFNLTDRRANDIEYFYRSRLPGEPADGVDDVHLHPAEPRTVRLSLRLGF
jgi:outer membrane receptor protein involved in Fe transport